MAQILCVSLFLNRLVATLFVAIMFAGSVHADVVLQTFNGKLTGATGVTVRGLVYDVSFGDRSCADLYSGCNEQSDFVFQDSAHALDASAALLAQVFLDGSLGNFDSIPSLTIGCTDVYVCNVYTPYGATLFAELFGVASNNFVPPRNDLPDAFSSTSINPIFRILETCASCTLAVWQPAKEAEPSGVVSEPSSIALMGLAVLALGWAQRRNIRVNAHI